MSDEDPSLMNKLQKMKEINSAAILKNKRIMKKWLIEYKKTLELEEDLNFVRETIHEIVRMVTYIDKYENSASNREKD